MSKGKKGNGAIMSQKAACEFLGLGKWTVHQLVISGKLKVVKCSGNSRIRYVTRASVEAFAKGE